MGNIEYPSVLAYISKLRLTDMLSVSRKKKKVTRVENLKLKNPSTLCSICKYLCVQSSIFTEKGS